jgi:hypothetical protein
MQLPAPKSVGRMRNHGYDGFMAPNAAPRRKLAPVWRALVEVVFIIFLFYSNLLMGEFNRSAGAGKTLSFALHDILTATNFTIALFSASIGYLIFEFLRKKF